MFRDSNIKKQIVIGLITSIVAAMFLQPLLEYAWRALNNLTSSIAVEFTNSIYGSAALGLREIHSFVLLSFMLSVGIGVFAGVLIAPLFNRSRDKQSESDSIGDEPREDPIRKESRGKMRFVYLAACVVAGFGLISATSELTRAFADLQLNATFNQRLTALGPELSDSELKKFRARWALMTNRADYRSIQNDLEAHAKSRNVKLPPSLWE
jgi:hypothetical protein